jgi:hypothetical protein
VKIAFSPDFNMNETSSKTKGQREKLGMLGKVSFLCALIAWLFPIVCVLITVVIAQVFEYLNKTISEMEVFNIFYHCTSTVPIVLCIVALCLSSGYIFNIKLKNRNTRISGNITCAVILSLVGLYILFFCIRPFLMSIELSCRRMESREDLERLGKAMLFYIGENSGNLPLSNKWCDLLLQSGYVIKKDLIFKGRGQEHGYYAINPDCGPNSPPDTVLLFEAKGGWNQFGGPEILTTENHKGEGCCILFIDTHVYFVKTEELGNLKWKPDEAQQE